MFQFIAAYLVSKNVQFKFSKTYLEFGSLTVHSDNIDGKIWIERGYGKDWLAISSMELLKTWLKDNV